MKNILTTIALFIVIICASSCKTTHTVQAPRPRPAQRTAFIRHIDYYPGQVVPKEQLAMPDYAVNDVISTLERDPNSLQGGPNQRNAVITQSGAFYIFYVYNGAWYVESHSSLWTVRYTSGVTRVHYLSSI